MSTRQVVVVGASAGGFAALRGLLGALPYDLPLALFIVVHVSPDAPSTLPDLLSGFGALPVDHARHGARIMPGRVYVAGPGRHLVLKPNFMELTNEATENRHRPAIDVLFRTAAHAYGPAAIGVVLSGMLDDGTYGAAVLRAHGATVFAQTPSEARFPDMPRNAIERGGVAHVLPAAEIGAAIVRLAHEPVTAPAPEVADDAMVPSPFSCPDCGGVLHEHAHGAGGDAAVLRFRCHVGHAYSADSLVSAGKDALEASLFASLRATVERIKLLERLTQHAQNRGHDEAASRFGRRLAAARTAMENVRIALQADAHDTPEPMPDQPPLPAPSLGDVTE
jgi:two-component system, chemotaxis family, protein-glutamate methylesterase/glutaminase